MGLGEEERKRELHCSIKKTLTFYLLLLALNTASAFVSES